MILPLPVSERGDGFSSAGFSLIQSATNSTLYIRSPFWARLWTSVGDTERSDKLLLMTCCCHVLGGDSQQVPIAFLRPPDSGALSSAGATWMDTEKDGSQGAWRMLKET